MESSEKLSVLGWGLGVSCLAFGAASTEGFCVHWVPPDARF